MKVYRTPEEVPWDHDRWPTFSPEEFACKCNRYCGGQVNFDPHFMDMLQTLRRKMGHPLVINSGTRCIQHNKAIGGAKASKHTHGCAVDISLNDVDRHELLHHAERVGFRGIGYGETFLHLDSRDYDATWYYGPESKRLWKK